MKPCTVAYLPTADPRFHTQAFIENLRDNRTKHDLILFSDTDWLIENFEWPERLKIVSPEKLVTNTHDRPFNISNLLFLTALKIVGVKLASRGYTHFLYLECDCRVRGEHWDETIWTEFQTIPNGPPLIAGSICVYNPAMSGDEGMARFEALRAKNTRSNFPVSAYRSRFDIEPCVMVYGAGGVYNIAAMMELFAPITGNTVQLAQKICAFDLEIGKRIWKRHGARSYDVIGQLDSIYSGYGDVVTTLDQRMEMLRSGSKVLIHQCKENISK